MNKKGEIMSEQSPQQPTTSLLEVVASFLFGGAVLTMALFPLAVPMVALLIVVALPLLALGAGVAAIVAALIGAGHADPGPVAKACDDVEGSASGSADSG